MKEIYHDCRIINNLEFENIGYVRESLITDNASVDEDEEENVVTSSKSRLLPHWSPSRIQQELLKTQPTIWIAKAT
ncbi:uncharacterized protein B0P05DRAFT_585576 [Gilbertella persicaria]|uniref:Uncharacterized protein n=1 Tax=Rhizopus stolonifer TaxID=4846 RepID=A0A367J1W2_RHIST|nr:uncharacterized protein B0P05DRAFT_585576 [Gilbertella persicaria]KAI8084285.1 hypothetical protein B0P05DRAFT_585576 [Gilbertella persicaria]RCH83925.1 hypothetical protein CU098_008176 [Rhizopus stolonifer]